MSEVATATQVLAKPMPSRGWWRRHGGAKRPSASALGGKSNVKPNGRRRCDGADYETVSPIISKKVYGNSWEILFYDLPMLSVGYTRNKHS